MIDWADDQLPISTQADLLSLNRSSLYYQPLPPSPEELWIKRRIDELYTACPFYGSRKITVELNKELLINRKAVCTRRCSATRLNPTGRRQTG